MSRFRRNLSFPNPISKCPSSPKKPYHTRSTSLPCRSHPLISQLKDEINNLKTWESNPKFRTSSWLNEGLIMLKNVYDSFEDLLHLSQTQDSLRRRSDWVETLLEDYLRFVDVYGILRTSIVSFKEDQLKAEVAVRRRDELKIGLYIRERKKMDKEMIKLISKVRFTGRYSVPLTMKVVSDYDAELAGILRDVNEVTEMVTTCLIRGISSTEMKRNSWKNLWNKKSEKEEGIKEVVEVIESLCELRIKGVGGEKEEERFMALGKLKCLDECIEEIEIGSEKVFRSLISTRVSLLNILT